MSNEIRSLNEECGIFGIWSSKQASNLSYLGLNSLQHRGQEGAGIAALNNGRINCIKNIGLLTQVFQDMSLLNQLNGSSAIGHVRYSTSGDNKISNIQPLLFEFTDEQIALAHNGNLTNSKTLKSDLEKRGHIFHSTSDSELLMHLVRLSDKATFQEKLKEGLNFLKGGFAYLTLTKDALYVALDRHGFRPISIGTLNDGGYVVASETCAIDAVGGEFLRDVLPGELIKISNSGLEIDHWTDETKQAICSMEYIYFARPDSNILGINVHKARKRMGINLAKESPVDADIVIGIPNSSLSAASGYSEQLNLPYEMGLIKNQYVGREFIQPNQELREASVCQKLSAIKGVVKGKKVVLVDDSIVRGTTSKRIVKLLRDAGAKEVHLRIASTPFKYPSFFGIDIQNKDELIASKLSIEEMNNLFNSDSLAFLSEEGLIDSIGTKFSEKYNGLDMSYFNGDYPEYLYDYEYRK
ncbi:amidophosphoribosyltransferase [Lactobacillus terrae]|uniref:amidophosphoribosyltransferase n=1 Tax=Lactobacillus terrae TaxID=2269374 RepID=UPI000C1B718F|nr:amidophosphoribosyltransferase [Lactobacillus terrae]